MSHFSMLGSSVNLMTLLKKIIQHLKAINSTDIRSCDADDDVNCDLLRGEAVKSCSSCLVGPTYTTT
jgi:hypothetical protein